MTVPTRTPEGMQPESATSGMSGSGADEEWDVVIAPASPWWRLDLGEVWRYRDLLRELLLRDLTAVYKQTILGPIWVLLQPLITSLMFAVIFGLVARMSLPGYPALLFYMSAIVPWSFFAGVINKTSATLVTNSSLMTKVYFPRLIPPLATMGSSGFTFLVQLTLFFVFALAYRFFGSFHWSPGIALLALPALVLLELTLALGVGLIVASLTTKYKDLGFLIGFAVQLLMYMSPVIFPLAKVKMDNPVRPVLEANPITPVIEGFRGALLGTPMDWSTLWYSAIFAVVALLMGLALFQRAQRSYADVV